MTCCSHYRRFFASLAILACCQTAHAADRWFIGHNESGQHVGLAVISTVTLGQGEDSITVQHRGVSAVHGQTSFQALVSLRETAAWSADQQPLRFYEHLWYGRREQLHRGSFVEGVLQLSTGTSGSARSFDQPAFTGMVLLPLLPQFTGRLTEQSPNAERMYYLPSYLAGRRCRETATRFAEQGAISDVVVSATSGEPALEWRYSYRGDGSLAEMTLPSPYLPARWEAVSEEEALAEGEYALGAMLAKPILHGGVLLADLEDLNACTVELRLPAKGGLLHPSSAQRVSVAKAGTGYVLTSQGIAPPAETLSFEQLTLPREVRPWLEKSSLIDPNAEKIRETAESLKRQSRSLHDATRLVHAWVRRQIESQPFRPQCHPAHEVYEHAIGTDLERHLLAAALLRGMGVPARLALVARYSPDAAGFLPEFGLEVYLSEWYSFSLNTDQGYQLPAHAVAVGVAATADESASVLEQRLLTTLSSLWIRMGEPRRGTPTSSGAQP